MTVAPGKAVVVDYLRNNPADTGTYFVQAVISDQITGSVLATLDLADHGNGYYSIGWTTPGDPSGTGRQLRVLYTVYEDAGYTIVSDAYGSLLENWVISEALTLSGLRAVSQGASQSDIRRIVRDVLGEQTPTDLAPVTDALKGLRKHLETPQEEAHEDDQIQYVRECLHRIEDCVYKIEAAMPATDKAVAAIRSDLEAALTGMDNRHAGTFATAYQAAQEAGSAVEKAQGLIRAIAETGTRILQELEAAESRIKEEFTGNMQDLESRSFTLQPMQAKPPVPALHPMAQTIANLSPTQ